MDKGKFSNESLMEEASNVSGLRNFGPENDHFREALSHLVCAVLDAGKLKSIENFREFCIHSLVNRLKIQECIRKFPWITEIPVRQPLFVTGLPRSGTTFLLNLLECDPHQRTLKLWELLSPPPDDLLRPSDLSENRISVAENLILSMAEHGVLGVHPMRIFGADECHFLFQNSFQSRAAANNLFLSPAHGAWIFDRDLSGAYEYYKMQLQVLLWQRACPVLGHLVLKSPGPHLYNIPLIFKVFPDAQVLILSRDIVSVFKSLLYLRSKTVQHSSAEREDLVKAGSRMLDVCAADINRFNTNLKLLSPDHRKRLHILNFESWIKNPVADIRSLYSHLGFYFDPEFEKGMMRQMAKSHKSAKTAEYDLDQYGLSEELIYERLQNEIPERALRL